MEETRSEIQMAVLAVIWYAPLQLNPMFSGALNRDTLTYRLSTLADPTVLGRGSAGRWESGAQRMRTAIPPFVTSPTDAASIYAP